MCCSKNDGIKIILNWIGRVANYNPLAIKTNVGDTPIHSARGFGTQGQEDRPVSPVSPFLSTSPLRPMSSG